MPLDFFLVFYTEAVFFIDYKKTKIMEIKVFLENPVGTYNNINLALF